MRHRPLVALLLLALLAAGCASPFYRSSPPLRSASAVAIGAVQGAQARSPLAGERVTVEGVVTADFREGLGGWFVQDEGDDDPATSDALFVVDAPELGRIRQGDRVRVDGTVREHGEGAATLTALAPEKVKVLGRGVIRPTVIAIAPEDWERYEGMLLRVDAPLTVSGNRDLARRGVLLASLSGRLPVPTEVAAPGEAAARVAADNARRSLLLDDASAADAAEAIWYLPADAQAPRAGSTAVAATGILDQRWGAYRLQLVEPLALRPAPRPAPPAVAGDTRIAAFNLESLFNGDGAGGGFPTARGARTPAELQRQMARLVAAIGALGADVAALMELENDGYGPASSIAQLVDALNRGGGDWAFVDAGAGPGGDAIRVGLIYRSGAVRPVGPPATLEEGPFAAYSRAPLAQAFRRGDGPPFVVVANHFKSKGCGGAAGGNRDQGDGQGCWNATRLDSAQRLMRWLDTDPTGTGSDLVAIVGDFNAYTMEDPIQAFVRAGWREAFAASGAGAGPHGYVYDGQAGRLDHALLSPALAERLAGAAKWHINADEPANLGYRAVNGGDPVAEPWRSSDHDPLLVGLRLGNE